MNVCPNIHEELSKILKETILVEHVYPYLLQKQNSNLLEDLKSLVCTLDSLDEIYSLDLKPIILFNDLMYFMNNRVVSLGAETSTPNYLHILHRFYKDKKLTDEEIYSKFLNINYTSRFEKNINRINRTILGMMNREERDYFLKNYINT